MRLSGCGLALNPHILTGVSPLHTAACSCSCPASATLACTSLRNSLKCLGRLHRCLGGKAGDFPMPSLSVEAQQRLECDPEAWECRWAEQVRLTLNIMKFSHD